MSYRVTIVDAVFNTGAVLTKRKFDTFDEAQDFVMYIQNGLETEEEKEQFLANVTVEEVEES